MIPLFIQSCWAITLGSLFFSQHSIQFEPKFITPNCVHTFLHRFVILRVLIFVYFKGVKQLRNWFSFFFNYNFKRIEMQLFSKTFLHNLKRKETFSFSFPKCLQFPKDEFTKTWNISHILHQMLLELWALKIKKTLLFQLFYHCPKMCTFS